MTSRGDVTVILVQQLTTWSFNILLKKSHVSGNEKVNKNEIVAGVFLSLASISQHSRWKIQFASTVKTTSRIWNMRLISVPKPFAKAATPRDMSKKFVLCGRETKENFHLNCQV